MTDFFKGGGNHRGSEGLIKDGCKQTSKLINTGPQNTDSNPIRSGCFPDVHSRADWQSRAAAIAFKAAVEGV